MEKHSSLQCNGDHSYDNHRQKEMYQTTKKFGCTAQVIMREVMRFPQHKVMQHNYQNNAIPYLLTLSVAIEMTILKRVWKNFKVFLTPS